MNPDVASLIDELRELGAVVDTGKPATDAKLRRAEATLGFPLPSEFREFVQTFGELKIALERTWNFYGLDEALRRTKAYRKFFDEWASSLSYSPKRFVVVHDEGDYSKEAAGTVYDADLDALIVTDGDRAIVKEDAFAVTYWGFLLDTLEEIRDRIADPEDGLVSGGSRDITRRQKELDRGGATPAAKKAATLRAEAIEAMYATFAKYSRQKAKFSCDQGKRCKACKTTNEVLSSTPLRELPPKGLDHYAYSAYLESAAAKADYKHFIPRIVELIDPIGWTGNPQVVIAQILGNFTGTEPTAAEDAAVEQVLLRHFEWLLQNSETKTATFEAYLNAIANRRPDVGPFIDAWTALLAEKAALAHAAAFARVHLFDYDAAGHGWPEAPFAKLRAWLFSDTLRKALKAAGFREALEAIEHGEAPDLEVPEGPKGADLMFSLFRR